MKREYLRKLFFFLLFLPLVLCVPSLSAPRVCPYLKIAAPHWIENRTKRNEKVKAWDDSWLNKAEKWMEQNGTLFKRMGGTHSPYLQIIATEEGSNLNQLLFDLKKKRPSIKFIFSPKKLLRLEEDEESGEGFYKVANASYNSDKTSVQLPVDSIATGEVTDSVHHEILHGIFDYFRDEGVDSAFHGRFTAVDEDIPIWNSSTYNKHLSIEEFATHSLNLRLIAIKIETLLKESPYHKSKVAELVHKAQRRAKSMVGFSKPALRTLRKIRKSLLVNDGKVEVVWNSINEDPYYMANLFMGNVEYSIPLPTFTNRTPVEKRKTEILRKLDMQIKIASGVLKMCTAIKEAEKPMTKNQVEAFLDLLNSPRDLTLDYITLP